MSAPRSAELDSALSALETHLRTSMDTLLEASLTLDDGNINQDSQRTLHSKIDDFFSDLEALERAARDIPGDVMVPSQVIEQVDCGVNPDRITQYLLLMAQAKNDAVRGKVFSTKASKEHLEARLQHWEHAKPVGDSLGPAAMEVDEEANGASSSSSATPQPQPQQQ